MSWESPQGQILRWTRSLLLKQWKVKGQQTEKVNSLLVLDFVELKTKKKHLRLLKPCGRNPTTFKDHRKLEEDHLHPRLRPCHADLLLQAFRHLDKIPHQDNYRHLDKNRHLVKNRHHGNCRHLLQFHYCDKNRHRHKGSIDLLLHFTKVKCDSWT